MPISGKNLRLVPRVAVVGCMATGSLAGAGEELVARYTPYAAWPFEAGRFAETETPADRYWRPAAEIRAGRPADAPPLSGLRLALDPGHLGGAWADAEGREFRMAEADFWVREGELALLVAREARDRLEALGAEVWLLRDGPEPVNPRRPVDYVAEIARETPVSGSGLAELADYALDVRDRVVHEAVVVDELRARVRRVNRGIRPDALVSLHINAAPWPEPRRLVSANHTHVLIYGCLTRSELESPKQRERLAAKVLNGSGPEERALAGHLARALADALELPPSEYSGTNAVRLDGASRYVWARNLLILRGAECPAVLLEPFVANSESGYARIQRALAARHAGRPPAEDDVLGAYAEAIVGGVLGHFGPAVGK